MKKWLHWGMIFLSFLVVAAVVVGVVLLLSSPRQAVPDEALDQYLKEQWPAYTLESYDAEAKTLYLGYSLDLTYEQAVKYGAAAGLDEVAAGHADTMALIASGCKLHCGREVLAVTVTGYSSDGAQIYTSSSLDGVTACWDTE